MALPNLHTSKEELKTIIEEAKDEKPKETVKQEDPEDEQINEDDGEGEQDGGDEGQSEREEDGKDDETDEGQDEDGRDGLKETKKDEYKEKFIASSKEALVLQSRNKQFATAVDEAQKIVEPTDEELTKAYPEVDWDMATDIEKRLYKENYVSKKRFEHIHETITANKKYDEWMDNVTAFLGDESNLNKYSILNGKEQDFLEFAKKPTRVNVDIDDLVKAFSFDYKSLNTPKKATLLSTASGGEKTKPNTVNDSESVAKLRKTNPREYNRLVKEGKIKIEID